MHRHEQGFLLAATLGFFLTGCAMTGMGGDSANSIDVQPYDRVFLRVEPFNPIVRDELTQIGLDPDKVHDNLAAELHYELFLKKQEEARDSAGATVRVTVIFDHLQPGSGNSGTFIAIRLTSERDGEKGPQVNGIHWELRSPSSENVPPEFLSQDVPRTLAKEILKHMKPVPPRYVYNAMDMMNNPSITPLH